MAMVLTLTACGPPASRIPADVLVVGQVAEPKSLDPQAVTATNDFRILVNVYDGLVRFRSGTLQIEPALASSWDISDDGLTYTFHLRRDVSFHDGTPFNAQAVKFNFDRMLDEDHPYHDTGPFPLAFFFSAIRETEAVDAHTVRFHLHEPYAPLLSNLAYLTGLMVSPAAVKRYGHAFGRHPVGTGAFRFVDWQSQREVRLQRNPDYWDGPARSAEILFRPLSDLNARATELFAGGIDVMLEVPPDLVPVFRDDPGFAVHEEIGAHLWFLILNMREGPFRDRRMRRAVNYAIDKDGLIQGVLQGTATPAAGPIPKAFRWAYNEAVKPYPYDPQRARELIAAAGYQGAHLVFYVAESGSGMLSPVAMGTAIQADLAQVGLEAEIRTFEWNTYLARVNRGLDARADMAEMAWMTNDPDTLPYLTLRTQAQPQQGGFNSGYYSSPGVDALLEAARRTTDRDERARLYRRVQAIVHDDAPWVFVASGKQIAATRAAVHGFSLQPSFLLPLREVFKQ
jgi:peptide/nickel transport system substrate-binding protein